MVSSMQVHYVFPWCGRRSLLTRKKRRGERIQALPIRSVCGKLQINKSTSQFIVSVFAECAVLRYPSELYFESGCF